MLLVVSQVRAADAGSIFGIHVVEEATGRGVPMVTLETTTQARYTTDSAGWVAFDEPGLLNKRVFFKVTSAGYAFPGNSLGLPGAMLETKAGTTAEIKILRTDIAERMYRVTGQGIYRDATRLGVEVPLPRPNLNGDMIGHGAVQTAVYRGKIFWTWHDAVGLADPSVLPRVAGATSDLPTQGGLDPSLGIHFDYIGSSANGPAGQLFATTEPGIIRLDGLLTAKDGEGKEHLLAHYVRDGAEGKRLEHGIAEYNGIDHVFEPVTQLGEEFSWQCPRGHAVRIKVDSGEFFCFGDPFLVTRVPVNYEDVLNPSKYEALAWSKEENAAVWQSQSEPLTQGDEAALVADNKLRQDKARQALIDARDGKPLVMNSGSVQWNSHRKRWLMIASGIAAGTDSPASIWFAEAEQPDGPWGGALMIAKDAAHSLAHPFHHEVFDQESGRVIYFEALLTAPQSGGAIPRYENNQLLYRLDLADPRLDPAKLGR